MMTMQNGNPLDPFHWSPQPAAFIFVLALASDFLGMCPEAGAFAARMHNETGTRFIDWIDHIRLNRRDPRAAQLKAVGYQAENDDVSCTVLLNRSGVFPPVLLWDGLMEIAIKVESAIDFLAENQLQGEVLGSPLAILRSCRVFCGKECAMTIVERHGTRAFEARDSASESRVERLAHMERFRTRPRSFENDEAGFEEANRLIDSAIKDLGQDLTCDLWFAAERECWMRRNRAAQVQKSRQDKLGLGWANHDHHTYRSSRKNFKRLISTWEKLGLRCRERFYAGREAGWGAQVMEQPACGIITFNDVDLTPDELMGDFSHEGLQEHDRLGTVGLWCGLHGDSFLQSGMHHLEAMFDFDSLSKQLEDEANVKTMQPFTDFTYLRQAFTEGERWPVDPRRIEKLLNAGMITSDQAEKFRAQGAIGSHLENLERNDGFKGFNQEGVNAIITATDPRKHIGA
jgi:hypothetical protein